MLAFFRGAGKVDGRSEIAIAEALVRELKLSVLLPITISTPLRASRQQWPEIFAGDWIATMARKTKAPTLGQIQDALRAHSFEVTESAGTLKVAKYGCAAVLVASNEVSQELGTATGTDTAVAY